MDINEALRHHSGLTKRKLSWATSHFKLITYGKLPLHLVLVRRTVQVPRYLDQIISEIPSRTEDVASASWVPRTWRRYSNEIQDWYYGRYLDKLHIALSGPFDGCSLDRCAWVSVADGRTCDYSHTESIAQSLDIFQHELLKSKDLKFTICGMNVNADDEFERYNSSYAPGARVSHLLALVLEDRWHDYYERIEEQRRQMNNTSAPQLSWQARLPSAKDLSSKDPSLNGIDLLLNWVHERPVVDTFLGFQDGSIYLSEPYTKRPDLQALRIVMITGGKSTTHKLMLMTTSGAMLMHLKLEQDLLIEANEKNTPLEMEDQIAGALAASVTFIVAEVSQYISDAMKVVQAMDMSSRRNPSLSKVQVILHLRECHEWAAQACRRNAGHISTLVRTQITAHEHLRRQVEDLQYLADELETQMEKIDSLREIVVSQIDLFERRRTRIVGILIAVYVPLAFATSFFGMNIEDKSLTFSWTNTTSVSLNSTANETWPWYMGHEDWFGKLPNGSYEQNRSRNFSDVYNITLHPDTPVFYSATETTSDQPGTLTWPWWLFGTVAGSLTFGSIILPLIAGPIYRSIARFSLRHTTIFRATVTLLWLPILIVSTFPDQGHTFGRAPFFLELIVDGTAIGLGASVMIYKPSRRGRRRWMEHFWRAAPWSVFVGCACTAMVSRVIKHSASVNFPATYSRIGWLFVLIQWNFLSKRPS